MSENKEYIKLSEYAKFYEVPYRTAFDWWKKGKLKGYQNDKGSIFIDKKYIEDVNMQKDKLISQKYFMECVENNILLSCLSNVVFGSCGEIYEHQYDIEDTNNIDIILNKVNDFLIKSFTGDMYRKILQKIDIQNITPTTINKHYSHIEYYINRIIQETSNKHIEVILANKTFIDILQQSMFYKEYTFSNIPILELPESKLPSNIEGIGLFISNTSIIDIYVQDMPTLIREEGKAKLSIKYSSILNPKIKIIPFCFSQMNILDATKGRKMDGLCSANAELMRMIIPQLENYYALFILLKSLVNNEQVYCYLESIKIVSNTLIIDDKIKINYSNDVFTITYEKLPARNIKNIEYVILFIKLYIHKFEQFEYLFNINYVSISDKLFDGVIERFYETIPTQQAISEQDMLDKIFQRFILNLNYSEKIKNSKHKIRLIHNGIMLENGTIIGVSNECFNQPFIFYPGSEDLVKFFTDNLDIVLFLIELYCQDIDKFNTVLQHIKILSTLRKDDETKDTAEDFLMYIMESKLETLEENIKLYFEKIQKEKIKKAEMTINLLNLEGVGEINIINEELINKDEFDLINIDKDVSQKNSFFDLTGWFPLGDMALVEARMYEFIYQVSRYDNDPKRNIIICGSKVFSFFRTNRFSKNIENNTAFSLYKTVFVLNKELDKETNGYFPIIVLGISDYDNEPFKLELTNPNLSINDSIYNLKYYFKLYLDKLGLINSITQDFALIKLDEIF